MAVVVVAVDADADVVGFGAAAGAAVFTIWAPSQRHLEWLWAAPRSAARQLPSAPVVLEVEEVEHEAGGQQEHLVSGFQISGELDAEQLIRLAAPKRLVLVGRRRLLVGARLGAVGPTA